MADTLFVTGRLAEPALRAVVSGLEIDHQIAVMNISVAALMTTRWIAKRLKTPDGVDNIVIPGLCEGDVDALQQATGLPVRKGPADVRALPEWYGREAVRAELGPRDVRVFAEINDVQSLTREQVIDRALAYRADGADVIDLGLSLDRSWLTDGPPTIAGLCASTACRSASTRSIAEHIRMADASRRRLRAQPHAGHDRPLDGPARDAGADHARSRRPRGPRSAGGPRGGTGPRLPAGLDPRPDQLRLRRIARALRRGPQAPSPEPSC